ncbi:hypothetical protein C0J52_10689 [Blattella germanica]|nr:hypothetical protein C0J52_10689 [Blattella germanica]
MAPLLRTVVILFLACQLGRCLESNNSEAILVLFQKYSDSGNLLTVDQLQKLLEKIGNPTCLLDNSINVNNDSQMENYTSTSIRSCINKTNLSASDVIRKMDLHTNVLTAKKFELACPLILEQLENHASEKHHLENTETKTKPSSVTVWSIGFLAVTIICVSSLLGAVVMPFMDTDFYKLIINVLVGLAVGSLFGSGLFQLIPQSFDLAKLYGNHDYLKQTLAIWAGMWMFFNIEQIFKLISSYIQSGVGELEEVASQRMLEKWQQWNDLQNRDVYINGDDVSAIDLSIRFLKKQQQLSGNFARSDNSEVVSCISSPTELLPNLNQELEPLEEIASITRNTLQDNSHVNHAHRHGHVMHCDKNATVGTVAYMVIFGDAFHNLIDGLSIGAAFSEGVMIGISISDFAVLLNSGMPKKKALLYNFLSACTCYIGLVIGLLLGEIDIAKYIFGFAVGMFIYISMVDMVSELNNLAAESIKVSMMATIHTLMLQNFGIIIGTVILYVLSCYQDSITFG